MLSVFMFYISTSEESRKFIKHQYKNKYILFKMLLCWGHEWKYKLMLCVQTFNAQLLRMPRKIEVGHIQLGKRMKHMEPLFVLLFTVRRLLHWLRSCWGKGHLLTCRHCKLLHYTMPSQCIPNRHVRVLIINGIQW